MTTLDKMLQGLANALGASLSTLTTTAKTVVGAINELKSGLTTTDSTVSGHTSTIGSGSLNTTSQTLIGAVNELAASALETVNKTSTIAPYAYQVYRDVHTFSAAKKTLVIFNISGDVSNIDFDFRWLKSGATPQVYALSTGALYYESSDTNSINSSDTTYKHVRYSLLSPYYGVGMLVIPAGVSVIFSASDSNNDGVAPNISISAVLFPLS